MFKSKHASASGENPVVAGPAGDAAAASRLTGTPSATGAATTSAGTVVPPANTGAAAAPANAGTAAQPAGAGGSGTTARPVIPPPGKPNQPADTTGPATKTGPGPVKRATNNVRTAFLLVIGALIALFAVFNSQDVQVHWIFGNAVNTPLILVIAVAFVAGGLIGWLAAKLGARNRGN